MAVEISSDPSHRSQCGCGQRFAPSPRWKYIPFTFHHSGGFNHRGIVWFSYDVPDDLSLFCPLFTRQYQNALAVDKAFSYIIVTPHFHKVHHHYVQPHTDSNYGNIFSIWDHLFRTATHVKKMDDLVYGIDTHMNPEEHSSFKNLLMIPFQPYRPPVGSKFSDQ